LAAVALITDPPWVSTGITIPYLCGNPRGLKFYKNIGAEIRIYAVVDYRKEPA
jgi:hypothetical protein